MVRWRTPPNHAFVNPRLITPVLSSSIARRYGDQGINPIVIYPEVVSGNPLNAPLVVRYILNYPGLLGGDREYPPSDICYSHMPELAKFVGKPNNVLSPPLFDTSIFYPPPPGETRSGTCFYARKFRMLHPNEPLPPQVENSIEIDNMSPEETAEIYRRCEIMYCLENTAASTEAMLCGCPVVLLPNIHLRDPSFSDGPHEGNGYAWGDEPAQIEHAKNTVGRVREIYLASFSGFWKQLEDFVHNTQTAASRVESQPIRGTDLPMLGDWDFDMRIGPDGNIIVDRHIDHFTEVGQQLSQISLRLDSISRVASQVSQVLRPARWIWRRTTPLRHALAKIRGRV